MKKNLFLILLAASFTIYSCGGGDKKDNSTKSDSTKTDTVKKEEAVKVKDCPTETKLEVGGLKLAPGAFDVKNTYVQKYNEKELTIYFENFTSEKNDPNAKLTGNKVRVMVRVSSRNDKNIEPGIYQYTSPKEDYNKDGKVDDKDIYPKYMISEVQSKGGKSYLFWGAGDPNPGVVEIYDVTSSKICGKITVETLDNKTYGKQIIKGEFTVNF
ncbi:MAG: hypothetical protein V2A54_07950 [Bacteroidota bacterium]